MTEPVEAIVYLAMNEDGGWIVTTDESDALTRLVEEEGGYCTRVVKLTVLMTPPVMAEAKVTVPDEAGSVSLQAVE